MDKHNGIPVYLFKDELPSYIKWDKEDHVYLTSEKFKFGEASLVWEFKENSKLALNIPIGYESFKGSSRDQKRHSFVIWFYNEKPIDTLLTIEFYEGSDKKCYFNYNLNFSGFRTCWVMFDRDMEGDATEKMDKLVIKAPNNIKNHKLYINKIMPSVPIDARHHMRDYQVPQVNIIADEKVNSHWMSLYTFAKTEEKRLNQMKLKKNKIVCQNELAINTIKNRLDDYLKEMNPEVKDFGSLIETYKSYGIRESKIGYVGRPINYNAYFAIFDHVKSEIPKYAKAFDSCCLKDYVNHLYDCVIKYKSTEECKEKEALKQIIIHMVSYLNEQGFAYGSGMGTSHHLGYAFRNYFTAMYLFKKELREAGLLKVVTGTMKWYSGRGRLFYEKCPASNSNIDVLNTFLLPMLMSAFMEENTEVQGQLLIQYSKWLSYMCEAKPGLKGTFKIDGCGFHHANHYPAYLVGGLRYLAPTIYFLSGTLFKLAESEHKLVKKVVMSMRLYCNKQEWLMSLSARHPKGSGEHTRFDIEPFRYLALSGSPDGTQTIDQEVAQAYLRLEEDVNKSDYLNFIEMGLNAEGSPQGHYNFNYGCFAVHRKKDWLVGVRGHNRYIWANESYLNANLYGRYISHGHLQVMSQGNPINNFDSGFNGNGWDFNSWPGTTNVHLPINLLKSDVINVDTFSGFEEMLLSDETFCGGINLEQTIGVFGMKLHEHPKYEGSHRARKSYFFFDERIVCLGTNIQNINKRFPTRTTLFQNVWCKDEVPFTQSSNEIGDCVITDNKMNGYYIPKGQVVHLVNGQQFSRAQNTDVKTEGYFAKGYIEHGKAPINSSYEYMLMPNVTHNDMEKLLKAHKNDKETYEVIQKNEKAHIVRDKKSNSIGYVFFEPGQLPDDALGEIKGVNTPCLAVAKKEDDCLKISVCDPDLRLYEGIEENQYGADGKRKEVSLYSREWFGSESKSHVVKVFLKGQWLLEKPVMGVKTKKNDDQTIIEICCKDALSVTVEMKCFNS